MILGIDQGTTGSTAVILNQKGQIRGKATAAVPQHFPRAGWVEHDPRQIMNSIAHAVSGAITRAKINPNKIEVIGVTNQRETVSLFEGRKALHRFIVWQDRRTATQCQSMPATKKRMIERKTGLPIDPYFSSSKIQWLMKELKISKKRDIRFRTIDSFLLQEMTGQDVTEMTNAHRTQLVDLQKRDWSPELFESFGIPRHFAPKIIPSEGMNLKTKALSFLPEGIPIQAVLGDQQAALFGQVGWKPGTGKMTYGTGSFILVNTGEKPVLSKHRLASTIALQWKNGKTLYALEGSSFVCGAWIQWLRYQLGLFRESKNSEDLARRVKDSQGVFVIPALAGMGAPFWEPRLRGQIIGLTRGVGKEEVALASLEALCFQNRALIDAILKDSKQKKIHWRVDGGASTNNLLMQIQADVLQQSIVRPKSFEATAVGVGLLAAHSKRILSLKQIEALWKKDRDFHPVRSHQKKYQNLYEEWFSWIQNCPKSR
jgi:glycerol kinase